MKYIYIYTILSINLLFSQGYVGNIMYPHNYVEIRELQTDSSRIIGKIMSGEKFLYYKSKKSDWWKVESEKGISGYLYKNYIKPSGEKGVLIDNKIYGDSTYRIITKKRRFKSFDINIVLVSSLDFSFTDFYCKSLVTISKGDSTLHRIYYDDLNPEGSCAGIFLPKKQPLRNYFIFSKFGYGGEIFILTKSGKLLNNSGGYFFITKDKKYIVSQWASDLCGFSVFDLQEGKFIFSKDIDFRWDEWYVLGNNYYVRELKLSEENSEFYLDGLRLFSFDKLKFIKTDKKFDNTFKPVKKYIYPEIQKNCICN